MNKILCGLLAASLACAALAVRAADAPAENPAWTEAKAAAQVGPADVAIAGPT